MFWQEIEDYLLVNSSNFKSLGKDCLYRLIVAMGKVGRSNETFWKVFSVLYEQQQNEMSYDQRLNIMRTLA